jgi:Beta-lactamase enzyme family
MNKASFFFVLVLSLIANAHAQPDPWSIIRQDTFLRRIIDDPAYEVQVRYTQIGRNEKFNPTYKTYTWPVDNANPTYFYPASTVKIMLCALALEKINQFNKKHDIPYHLHRDAPYRMGPRPGGDEYAVDTTAINDRPSIAQDIRLVLTVSDNDAYNRLCDFVGLAAVEDQMRKKGYHQTDIVHRVGAPGVNNAFYPKLSFETASEHWVNFESYINKRQPISQAIAMPGHIKGKGYYKGDSLIMLPFDMGAKNRFGQKDQEQVLKAILFPQSLPKRKRFDLTEADYAFLRYWMSVLPRESISPYFADYQTYYDGYCKFLMFGDDTSRLIGQPRSFNKVGDAYGTLSDMAFICDPETGTAMMLTVTILCNSDGIFNDDTYDYDSVGYPFMGKLGRALWQYELAHPPARKLDLNRFRLDYQKRL